MKLNIAICDDERQQMEALHSAVLWWGQNSSHVCDVAVFSSAEAFLFEYDGNNSYDILLLDIEMEGMSGIELAKRLRQDGCHSEIIFITSHFEFYGEGYEVDALHYLIKPVDREKLCSVLEKAAGRLAAEPASVIINCEGKTIKLPERNILYAEALLHYTLIYTADCEYKIKENFSEFAKKLSDDFYHTHRSYYVSLKHIRRISRTSVMLDNGAELPLSRGKYDDINRAFIERN